jgi:hypothetical protein
MSVALFPVSVRKILDILSVMRKIAIAGGHSVPAQNHFRNVM